MTNVVLANIPQLVVSFAYIFFNNLLTCMLLAKEWSDYGLTFKPLRVSNPHGQQQSTYWLQPPWIYSMPLMAAMAVLHWATARSIFFMEIDVIPGGNGGNGDPLEAGPNSGSIKACGFSAPSLVLSLCVGGVLLVALVALAFRRLPPRMPLVGSCSLAISAACHANQEEGHLWLRPLKYGVIPRSQNGIEGSHHVGFSSEEVQPLEGGTTYA